MGKILDLTGERFGWLTATRYVGKSKWECKCDCGNTTEVLTSSLRSGNTKSCGCMSSVVASKDLTGQRFGRLVVKRKTDERRHGYVLWECECDCGNITKTTTACLRSGSTQSCGCYAREVASKQETTHGMSRTRIYKEWVGIKQRSLNENDPSYQKYYGAHGKGVCDEWRNSFESFYEWSMKEGYNDTLTIDRIDNSKGYSPENCRWVSNKKQQNNKTTNVYITRDGVTKTIAQWCEELGIDKQLVYSRHRNGWDDKDLFIPKIENTKCRAGH